MFFIFTFILTLVSIQRFTEQSVSFGSWSLLIKLSINLELTSLVYTGLFYLSDFRWAESPPCQKESQFLQLWVKFLLRLLRLTIKIQELFDCLQWLWRVNIPLSYHSDFTGLLMGDIYQTYLVGPILVKNFSTLYS